jgi:DNA modification methylase
MLKLDGGPKMVYVHQVAEITGVGVADRERNALAVGESDFPREIYIGLDDAVELTGFAAHYLRRLIRQRQLLYRGSARKPLIPWSEIVRLSKNQQPFWQLISPESEFDPDLALDRAAFGGEKLGDERARQDRWVEANSVEVANGVDWIRRLSRESVQTVVTSPPYWGQRRYEDEQPVTWTDGQRVAYGREATVEDYVRHTLEILRHLKRALRPDGTIWWVLGDTYQTRTIVRESTLVRWENYQRKRTTVWANNPDRRHSAGHFYLKDKDLTLAPFLVAHGAQHMGLYVRSIIIWSKQEPTGRIGDLQPKSRHMPEPVRDRPTTGHEYILLMARSDRYRFNANGSSESHPSDEHWLRNLRTVWSFPVSTDHGGHTAAFPLELPLRCIRLSTRPGDFVVDPFVGSGNTLIAAKKLGRLYAGCDISPTYVDEARRRLASVQLDFAGEELAPADDPKGVLGDSA